jgi:hypothetical protein
MAKAVMVAVEMTDLVAAVVAIIARRRLCAQRGECRGADCHRDHGHNSFSEFHALPFGVVEIRKSTQFAYRGCFSDPARVSARDDPDGRTAKSGNTVNFAC